LVPAAPDVNEAFAQLRKHPSPTWIFATASDVKKISGSHLLSRKKSEKAVCNNFIFFSTEQMAEVMIFLHRHKKKHYAEEKKGKRNL